MTAKKSKHPLAVSMREAQQRIADTIAAKIEADAGTAYRSVVDLARTGDVNSTRLQAARTILELAGVLGGKQTSITATATTNEREKVVFKVQHVEVRHIEMPPAEED